MPGPFIVYLGFYSPPVQQFTTAGKRQPFSISGPRGWQMTELLHFFMKEAEDIEDSRKRMDGGQKKKGGHTR